MFLQETDTRRNYKTKGPEQTTIMDIMKIIFGRVDLMYVIIGFLNTKQNFVPCICVWI